MLAQIGLVCVPFLATGCSDAVEQVGGPGAKPLAIPAAKPANRPTTPDSPLVGVWQLHTISADKEIVVSDITIEFTGDGEMVSRKGEKVESRGKYLVDGPRLVVTTKHAEGNETRETAHINQLSATEMEITNDANQAKLRLRREAATQ
jgi:uncharacterized protein (TIGR03066 family)